MDQHSIANKRLMDQITRARPGNHQTPSSSSTPSTFSASSNQNSSMPKSSSSQNLAQLNHNYTSANASVLAQAGYHAVAHTHTVQNPQLLAQNKKRAAAERAAIQQKIKNNITKSQMEAKKQKENHEKTRLWEDVILPNWEDYVNSSKLRDLCVKGIPNKLRGKVWPLLVQNELGIDEGMFETLCAEAQLLFHDKMTAARSRRKKAVNRESNAYGYQLPSNPNLANMTGNSQTTPENAQNAAQHLTADPTTNTVLEEDDMLMLDDDPLDADYYPKQTYILDEEAAMALESDGPYMFHHQHAHTTPASEMMMVDGSTTGGHAHSQVQQQPIPIPQMNGNLDLTEEDWFENERNGSMDEETFKLVQKQLFVKPVILPGLPIPAHLQSNLTHPSKEESHSSNHHNPHNSSTNTTMRRHSHTGGPSTSSLLFTPPPPINTSQSQHTQPQTMNHNNKPLIQQALLATSLDNHKGHNHSNGQSNSSSYQGTMAQSKDVASSLESNKYDPNTDFLPFDFDEDDAMVKTPIKSVHNTPQRPKKTFSNHSGTDNTTTPTHIHTKNNNTSNNQMDMEQISAPSIVINQDESTTSNPSMVTQDTNVNEIVKPIALLSPTPSAARARRSVLDIFDDDEEETPFGRSRHNSHHHEEVGEEDNEEDGGNHADDDDNDEENDEEEEGHSIMMPRLSRSSGALSALHGVLSRPTSALDHVLNHNNNNTDTPITPAEAGNHRLYNEMSMEDTSPKVEEKLDPPNPKLERLLRVVSLIEWDLPRTFPTLAFFHDGGVMHTGLERILLCFALYCPEIGYVQGLSFLVAMLLLQCMDEYEVFVCLTNMILAPSRGSLQDFYRIQKTSIDTFVGCFDYFFKKYLPLLHEHFQRESVESLMYLMDWHLSLFTKALPIEIAAKIWDVYLLEGEVYVLSVGLGVLKMYASKLATFSVEKISKFLLHLPDTIKSDELFAHVAQINITKKQYERIRKRFETSSTVASPPSQHVPRFPSQHQNKQSHSHGHKSSRAHSDASSGGYFSTSIFKSAVRSSIRALRTAVSSSSSSTTTNHQQSGVHQVSPRSASSSHVGNYRSNSSYTSPDNTISSSTTESSVNRSQVQNNSSSRSSSLKINNHETPALDRGDTSNTRFGTTPTSTHSNGKLPHSTFQQNLQELKTSRSESRSFSSRVSDVDEVSMALYNAGFLSMPPEVNHSSPSSSNRSSFNNSNHANQSIRRQSKSVNSLYDLEKSKQQQQQQQIQKESKEIPISDPAKLQHHRPTDNPSHLSSASSLHGKSLLAASSSSQHSQSLGDSRLERHFAQGDDEGPSFMGTSLEQQSQIFTYQETSFTSDASLDRPRTPPAMTDPHQSRSSLYEKNRPTPIAPTRQRITHSSHNSHHPGHEHAYHSTPGHNDTAHYKQQQQQQQHVHVSTTGQSKTAPHKPLPPHASSQPQPQPRRHSANSGTGNKKKEGGDCISS